jgi:hypothetical protein
VTSSAHPHVPDVFQNDGIENKAQLLSCGWLRCDPGRIGTPAGGVHTSLGTDILRNGHIVCPHLCCWKYLVEQKKYVSLETIRNADFHILRVLCRKGYQDAFIYLCDQFPFEIQDVKPILRFFWHSSDITEYLLYKYQWSIDDMRDLVQDAFYSRCARSLLCLLERFAWEIEDIHKLWLPRIQGSSVNYSHLVYRICEKFQLTSDDIRKNYTLHNAVTYGYYKFAKYLLGKYELTATDIREEDNYILFEAARDRQFEFIKYLCQFLTIDDICAKDNFVLHEAIIEGDMDFVTFLHNTFSLHRMVDGRKETRRLLANATKNKFLPIVEYICNTFSFTVDDLCAHNNHILKLAAENLIILQYLMTRYFP